jgi:hypothetical protein
MRQVQGSYKGLALAVINTAQVLCFSFRACPSFLVADFVAS